MKDHGAESVGAGLPALEVESHVEDLGFEVEDLRRLVVAALPHCLAAALPGGVLEGSPEVEVAIVDDPTIGRVHGEYLNDASVTDVITFDHGEILVSWDTARREAIERGLPELRELLLYVVHGLLHLAGHDDLEPVAREAMGRLQEEIVGRVWEGASPGSAGVSPAGE